MPAEPANGSPGRTGEVDRRTALQQAAAAGIQELQRRDEPTRTGGTIRASLMIVLVVVGGMAMFVFAGKALFSWDVVSNAHTVARSFLTAGAYDAARSQERKQHLDNLRLLGILMASLIAVPVLLTSLFMALAKRVGFIETLLRKQRARYSRTANLEKDMTSSGSLQQQWHRLLLALDLHTAGKRHGYVDLFTELEAVQKLQLVNLEVSSQGSRRSGRHSILDEPLPVAGTGTYRHFLTWSSHYAKYLVTHLDGVKGVSDVAAGDAHERQLKYLRARWCQVHVVSWVLTPIAFTVVIPSALALEIAVVFIALLPPLRSYLDLEDEIVAFSATRVFFDVVSESIPRPIV